jgi:MFS transporter, NNP family, nitrate/nitrite transporter
MTDVESAKVGQLASKYAPFDYAVDEGNKAKSLRLFSVARPHSRAFHFAWVAFFLAFFGWFAISPLIADIRDDKAIGWLNKTNVKNSNIVAVAGTIMMRLLVGPFCDRFGPRWAMSGIVTIFSLPVFLVGLSDSFAAFTAFRFFIGFIGATFVVVQFWCSIMYSGNVVGTVNATAAGWGNLGGGVTNLVMPQIVNGLQTRMSFDRAWRVAQVIPASALLLTGVVLFFATDDCPEGQYAALHKEGTKTKTNPFVSMLRAARNYRVWVLFLTYGGCFGIELVMNGNLATYIQDEYGVKKGMAGAIASLFGLMNLFARSLGGIVSDVMSKRWGMRGRLWSFFFVLFFESLALLGFSRMTTLGGAIPMLILFSTLVQMSEGATFGVVPFVDPEATGAISGIVGAGGNVGAVVGGFILKPRGTRLGFMYLGFCVIAISCMIPLIHFPQYGSMFLPASHKAGVVDASGDGEEPVVAE